MEHKLAIIAKNSLKSLNINDELHTEYLNEELHHYSVMNAWSVIDEVEHTINPNNLLISYLLGKSSCDPVLPRAIVFHEDGIEDKNSKAYMIKQYDGKKFIVHENTWVAVMPNVNFKWIDTFGRTLNVISGKLRTMPVGCMRPEMTLYGQNSPIESISVYKGAKFCEYNYQSDKNCILDFQGLYIQPTVGKHYFVNTNEFPDIDVDFPPDVLDKIIPWAKQRFGDDNVVGVAAYQRFGMKSSFKDVCRVYDIPLSEVINIAEEIPDDVQKLKVSDSDFEERWTQFIEETPALLEFQEKYPKIFNMMKRMQGRIRTIGRHASAMIISSVPLTGKVPLVSASVNGQRIPLSSWAEGQNTSDLSKFGFIKFDRLGLQTLNDINNCMDLIYSRGKVDRNVGFWRYERPKNIDITQDDDWMFEDWTNDEFTKSDIVLNAAANGETVGCFQFESQGIRNMLKEIHIDTFEEMTAANAMYRPGVLKAVVDGIEGGDKAFVKRKKGEIEYAILDVLKPYLSSTYGLLVYQEQVMQVLNVLGGIPMTDCESARKAISKKKTEVLNKYKKMFIDNANSQFKIDKIEAQRFFEENIVVWAGYGFNRSHAFAYALVAAQTLYLKKMFPIEFYCAFMSSLKKTKQDYLRARVLAADAMKSEIEIQSVHINLSKESFTIAKDTNNKEYIVYGLANIKKVGKSCEQIINAQPYSNFEDFLKRGCSKKDVVSSLIWAGAFDCFTKNKMELVRYFEDIWIPMSKKQVGVQILKSIISHKDLEINRDTIKEIVDHFKNYKETDDVENEINDDNDDEIEEITLTAENEASFDNITNQLKPKPSKMDTATFRKFIYKEIEKYSGNSFFIEDIVEAELKKIEPVSFNQFITDVQIQNIPQHLSIINAKESYGTMTPFLNPIFENENNIAFSNTFTPERGYISGFVDQISQCKTKSGKSYWKIKIDDGIETVNVLAFDRAWTDRPFNSTDVPMQFDNLFLKNKKIDFTEDGLKVKNKNGTDRFRYVSAACKEVKKNTLCKLYVSQNKYGFTLNDSIGEIENKENFSIIHVAKKI